MKNTKDFLDELKGLFTKTEKLVGGGSWFLYQAYRGNRAFVLITTGLAYELDSEGNLLSSCAKNKVKGDLELIVYFSESLLPTTPKESDVELVLRRAEML